VAFGTIFPSRGVGAVAAAIASALGAACPVEAEDAKVAAPQRTVLFASIDAGSSGFATVGAKRTLIGTLDESGPVALASIGAGGSPERMRSLQLGDAAFRPAMQASALVGYQWALGRTFLSLFAGPELDRDRFSSAGGSAREETRLGARVHGEIWMHPTDDTLLTGTAIAGSARGHLWTRASAGYKVWRDVFIGPEASLYRTDDYREWRLGAHATGVQLGRFTLRLSTGWRKEESSPRGGAYGGLSVHVKM
jgi:hypothetical protein